MHGGTCTSIFSTAQQVLVLVNWCRLWGREEGTLFCRTYMRMMMPDTNQQRYAVLDVLANSLQCCCSC